MAKDEKKQARQSAIAAARKELADAQQEYQRLISARPSAKRIDAHAVKCRQGLAAKRYARIKLDCLSTGRPVPAAEDLVETKELKK